MAIRDRNRRRVKQAAARRRDGDSPGAVDVLAEILAADPDDVSANAEMARALRVLGDPAGAEVHIRRALTGVLDYQLVVELAGVVAEHHRLKEAEELVDAALAMAGGNPRLDPGEALLVRAAIAAGQGRDAEARAALDAIEPKRAGRDVKRYAEILRSQLEG